MAEVLHYFCDTHKVWGYGSQCWMWDAPNADCLLVPNRHWGWEPAPHPLSAKHSLWAKVSDLIGNSDTFDGVRAR